MEIHQGSDLHLEFGRDLLEVPGGETLIINGDIVVAAYIWYYLNGNSQMLRWKNKRQYRRAERFFKECSERYDNVIYVLGNHEHYRFRFHKTAAFLRKWFEDMGWKNIHLLDSTSVVLDGIKFFGATLWTDMRKSDPMVMMDVKRGMNDCALIQYYDEVISIYGGNSPKWMTPQDMVREHEYSLKKLREELSSGHPTIVVTHHSPTYESIPHKYKMNTLSFAYSSDLSELILDSPNLLMWFHGHTHDKFRYMVGDTLVVCNPRGYFDQSTKKEIRKWDWTKLTLELAPEVLEQNEPT